MMNNNDLENREDQVPTKTPAQRSKEKEKKIIHFLKIMIMSILCVVAFSLLIFFLRAFFGGDILSNSAYASVLDGPIVTPAYESVENSLTGLHLQIEDPSPTPAPELDMENINFNDYGEKMVIGDAAYQSFTISAEQSQELADAINSSVQSLPSEVNFFTIIVPTAIDVMLPESFKSENSSRISDQGVAIDNINDALSSTIASIDIYDTLLANTDQKLYNKTDTNWTSLASYYAYTVWANRKSLGINTLDDYEAFTVEGYSGSLYAFIGGSKIESPESIVYYKPISNLIIKSTGESIFKNVEDEVSSNKDDVFLGGRSGEIIISNSNLNDGSVGIIIGDSTAYSLVPYLAEYYQTTYFLDYRDYDGSVNAIILENDVSDITYCISITAVESDSYIKAISTMY